MGEKLTFKPRRTILRLSKIAAAPAEPKSDPVVDLKVRLRKSQLGAVREAAATDGTSMSTWARISLLKAATDVLRAGLRLERAQRAKERFRRADMEQAAREREQAIRRSRHTEALEKRAHRFDEDEEETDDV